MFNITSRTSNILDPVQEFLDPSVWEAPDQDNPRLHKVHLAWIKDKVYSTLKAAGFPNPEKFCSMVFTGSLTTYQYSADSDVDISLFIDYDLAQAKRGALIGLMVDQVDGTILPGTTHPMQCFVVAPNITRDMLYQEGLRSGYDVDANSWIVPPDKSRSHDVEVNENGFYVTAMLAADKMERLLRYEPDKAVMYWHQIHFKRMRDQTAGKGDYSESNIIYKFLNNRGLFPKISEASGEYIAKVAHEWDWDELNAIRQEAMLRQVNHLPDPQAEVDAATGTKGYGCYDIAPEIERRYPHAKAVTGDYLSGQWQDQDHVWNRLPDGSILDATWQKHVPLSDPDHALYQEKGPYHKPNMQYNPVTQQWQDQGWDL